MAKSPALNFYSADYYIGTRVLTQAERGAYMDLICMFHQIGHLTYDQVIQFCEGKVYPNVIAKLSIDKDGLYYNKKTDKIIEEKSSYVEGRLKNFGEYAGKSPSQIAEIKKRRAEEAAKSDENTGKSPPDAPSTPGESKKQKTPRQTAAIFKPPSLEDVIEYFLAHGFDKNLAKRAWEGYEVANWHDSQGKAIKNWKQKMTHVWFKEENKIQTEKELTYLELCELVNQGDLKAFDKYERIEKDGKATYRKK
jgi:hypothetical protein